MASFVVVKGGKGSTPRQPTAEGYPTFIRPGPALVFAAVRQQSQGGKSM